MAALEWRPQALKDLEEIEAYYERVASDYATFLVEQVFEKTKQLERFPRMGRMVPEIEDEAIRELIYRDYRIIYIVSPDNEEVAVLAVIHAAQQLGGMDFDDD